MPKGWTRKIDKRMRSFGDIDESKKVIRVNPKKRELLNTIIHEELHKQYPDKPEKWISERATEKESNMSIKLQIKMLKKYQSKKKKEKSVKKKEGKLKIPRQVRGKMSAKMSKMITEYRKTGKITTSRAVFHPKSLAAATKQASAIEYGRHGIGRAGGGKRATKKKKRRLPPRHAPAWGRRRQERIGILPIPKPELEPKPVELHRRRMLKKKQKKIGGMKGLIRQKAKEL